MPRLMVHEYQLRFLRSRCLVNFKSWSILPTSPHIIYHSPHLPFFFMVPPSPRITAFHSPWLSSFRMCLTSVDLTSTSAPHQFLSTVSSTGGTRTTGAFVVFTTDESFFAPSEDLDLDTCQGEYLFQTNLLFHGSLSSLCSWSSGLSHFTFPPPRPHHSFIFSRPCFQYGSHQLTPSRHRLCFLEPNNIKTNFNYSSIWMTLRKGDPVLVRWSSRT